MNNRRKKPPRESGGPPHWSVAVGPDGRWVVFGSGDKTLRIRDLESCRCRRAVPEGIRIRSTPSPSPPMASGSCRDRATTLFGLSLTNIRHNQSLFPPQVVWIT
uniref:WD40-like Beta Propeller Repeat n=1 Tax=Candidatus Kentrum eta TaxID=2126337 RepID=A0A450V6A1_9GAMM|nr:MAG: hypothetical protein BECKH772A_GA0070896_101903 [Candidatus Kentron sp. H]VFK00340.1 MAG: hypothetical protein BECKH772B_GA0070898_101873 [Candidatus Kentron sp. H]VFK04510.1 MAG: hypothetical protein BECKH772C_GA0070978_101863 [Candidatus Kentron sp. H]